MREFWASSGYRLLARDDSGRLAVTDDFLRAYVNRPELRPEPSSNAAERELHAELLADPRAKIGEARLAFLADKDVRDNYRVLLAFRDRLAKARTLEACYLDIFAQAAAGGRVSVPPLFVDQLAHAILRGMLEGETDAFRARAGELFFREQKASLQEGAVLLADLETVEFHASGSVFGSLGRLVVEGETPLRSIELDVMTEDNAARYWERSERHDMVLDMRFGGKGLDAFCRLIEAWVRHFFAVEVSLQPVAQIRDERWRWHVGLDAEATALLNALYKGESADEDRLRRLLALFRMDFADPSALRPELRGYPVYLAYAMTSAGAVRIKPQNLLVNLPLARRS
jgi:hypothetical protein